MAKFYGKVGFGETLEDSPGVFVDVIVEHILQGDVRNASRQLRDEQGTQLNFALAVSNTISVVANAYASEHVFAIRYVEWAGERWTVSNVEIQPPRLLLHLGEVYSGPTPG